MKSIMFGKLEDGRAAGLYFLESPDGMRAAVTDYGAALVSIAVPDRKGVIRDVVLGHDDVSGYETGSGHIGAFVGRFANRIAGAEFELNGRTYGLTANNGTNCLHGGRDFFKNRLWTVKIDFTSVRSGDIMAAYASESIADRDPSRGMRSMHDNMITFCLDSPDGDQGFPGNMHIEVTYSLPGDGKLRIDYRAVSDADTPVSFTNHSYFNLNGHDSGTVIGHWARINAEYYTPVDERLIPLEEPEPVEGTPFDFREDKMLGRDINADNDQIVFGGGYDHNFIIGDSESEAGERTIKEAGVLYSDDSGICMTVLTDMPDMQVYTANGLIDEPGKDGAVYGKRSAVCFETQFRPNAINSSDPDVREGCILRAEEEFTSSTIYRFSNL
ncbi:MAG: galactose mutarotase [Mogibacterium sp.]|nr:galactose mutarotase [Mogibacterium sp.]